MEEEAFVYTVPKGPTPTAGELEPPLLSGAAKGSPKERLARCLARSMASAPPHSALL